VFAVAAAMIAVADDDSDPYAVRRPGVRTLRYGRRWRIPTADLARLGDPGRGRHRSGHPQISGRPGQCGVGALVKTEPS
jgi:hypothetical protein